MGKSELQVSVSDANPPLNGQAGQLIAEGNHYPLVNIQETMDNHHF